MTLKDGEEERCQAALDGGLSLQDLLNRISGDTGHESLSWATNRGSPPSAAS